MKTLSRFQFWSRLLGLSLAVAISTSASSDDWPQWRGPQGDSVSRESGLPLFWSENEGKAWKTPLPGWGTSTPAIWGDAVFVTSQEEDQLLVLRINKEDGAILWKCQVGTGTVPREAKRGTQKFHQLHNLASPSPVTNGQSVFVHFGNGLLAAYDFDGQLQWKRNLQEDYGPYSIWWGHANSPVLYKNLLISVCMQDSLTDLRDTPSPSYVVAHDIATGEVVWKTMRTTEAAAEECDAYTTPVFYETDAGTQMIIMGGNQLDAYDPADGRQLWFLPRLVGGRTVTGPTVAEDKIFVTRGMRRDMLAIRLGGKGELTQRDVAWHYDSGTADTCCPVAWDNLLFVLLDSGILKCFDIENGQLRWHRRIKGGDFKTSPLAAEGRIYLFARDGLCTVMAASDRFDKLAENQLDDEILASPAISDGRILVRGRKSLYALEKR